MNRATSHELESPRHDSARVTGAFDLAGGIRDASTGERKCPGEFTVAKDLLPSAEGCCHEQEWLGVLGTSAAGLTFDLEPLFGTAAQ